MARGESACAGTEDGAGQSVSQQLSASQQHSASLQPRATGTAVHPPPGLTMAGVGVSYGGRPILADLDLTVSPGEITCLLGPSGIGKSTLLRRVAGLVEGAGTIRADDGKPLSGRMALMGQGDGLLPWLTVLDNVTFGARLRGARADRDRAMELLDRLGLTAAARQRPAELSGGMRQRAALARTLMEDRPLVLMDEPFSAVDALTRLRLQDLAATLLADRTVLMVTHDPWEAIRIGQSVIVMNGSPARIILGLRPDAAVPRSVDSESSRDCWRQVMTALGEAAA